MQQLSRYLLTLTRGALEKPTHEFKDWALNETKHLIPFDSCVWLMGNWMDEMPVINSIHTHQLRAGFIENWARFQHEDKLAREITSHNNHTLNVNVADEYASSNIYQHHCIPYGIQHIVATASIDRDTQLFCSMCLYRANTNQPFTEQERSLKEIIFEHLIEAVRINWLIHLPNMHAAHQPDGINAIAACNEQGLLHSSTPSFFAILRQEWPKWTGALLPDALLNAAHTNANYIGRNIIVSLFKTPESILLRARSKVPADSLTGRELAIAEQITEGHNCKAIALKMDVSPGTIKTHTANLYLKLNINSKAQLAQELHRMQPP
jgi:DNA-binding CsgD family transcriptional regulator